MASGKTSTAEALAGARRQEGKRAAAIDMDDIVMMVAGRDWTKVRKEHWDMAWQAAGAAIDSMFAGGCEFVALAGPFFSQPARDAVTTMLKSEARICLALLDVPLEETLERASHDSDRVLTKDPDFIRRIYATINWDGLPEDVIRVGGTSVGLEEVVQKIEAALASL